MSENKGAYVFDHKLLNKRLEDLKRTPPTQTNELIEKLIDMSDQVAAIAGVMMLHEVEPTYTDEEVRDLARMLRATIEGWQRGDVSALEDAREFLHNRKYFNLNQSDLV